MGTPVVSPAVQGYRAGLFVVGVFIGIVAAVVLAGCGGAGVGPSPSPTPSSGTSSSAAPIPADGAGLRAYGIVNGPAQFSVPRTSVASTIVDQANNVVLVLSAPSGAEIGDYLQRTLPGAGFVITDDDPADDTFTFVGQGWSGSFTSGDGASAVLLRPQ